MPIKPLEQKKRQKILLFVGLGAVVITLLILYFSLWKKATPAEETTTSAIPISQRSQSALILEEKLKKIKLDFDFLNEKILSFLKIHGDLPVEKGETGRDNPYVPY
ncbi:MAG: hypothetical protein A2V69_03015 [Candidatus Portnoybacteria bacterium RBG_13_40_8]|uniref:Uncharacterized protein n=1 Tax=Candidatus Portnoybacteria bacterium RBG_13_40_8 TaxID=1801990 RepID=A0A1G2F4K6_9BACT|nr:MAG: hypothetical protein A2V69_03015 [Candidatus Portnoybacteria bacterium RBG_13_40_8]OGZ35538.1 MAG: hypothetical protein A2V60_02450 [Candidatus Portnoybacteria bacterium RIFCSPHIGHO2_01_FULL_39_19]